MQHDFLVPIVDTDSVTVCKRDGAPFSRDEIDTLTKEINSLTDELIKWDFEFNMKKIIAVKSKNYIMYDGEKVKIKGGALKATTKAPAVKEFIRRIIDGLIHENVDFKLLYEEYVREIMDVKDIKRWSVKKTVTDKVMKAERTNEQKVKAAITSDGDVFNEGDKVYVFYRNDESLCLAERFDGVDYDKKRLLKNLHDTINTFCFVIDKTMFVKYGLKKNLYLLDILLDRETNLW